MFKTISFQTNLAVGASTPQEVVTGDFNGDGIADLFIPTLNFNSDGSRSPLLFLAGATDGSFRDVSASLFGGNAPTATYAARVVTGDFNGDGRPDILVLDSGPDKDPFPGGQNELLVSTPSGMTDATASLPQLTIFSHGAAVGDYSGDGKLDAAVFVILTHPTSAGSSPAVLLLKGDGRGGLTADTASTPTEFTTPYFDQGSTWGGLIDVNGDGKADLIVGGSPTVISNGSTTTRPTDLFLNPGGGDFSHAAAIALPSTGVSNASVMQVISTDLNGDGIADLALSITNSGQGSDFYTVPYIQLLIGDGQGHFRDETQARLPQPLTPTSAALSWDKFISFVDVDGDGSKDIVASNESQGVTTVYLNDGQGHFHALADTLPNDATGLFRSGASTPYAFAATSGGKLQIVTNDAPSVMTAAGVTAVLRTPPNTSPAAMQLVTSVASGAQTFLSAAHALSEMAATTTSVATLAYQFFTGHTPSSGGLDYLISPSGPNLSNINSTYYRSFSIENRYINFAVNLGKLGEGAASFTQAYGGLSLADATKKAYATVFGTTPTDTKVSAILTAATGLPGIATRADYFAYYGQDGATGIGTKAAMVGYLLVEAVKADVGVLQTANLAYLTDLALGHVSGSVDLVGVYHGIPYGPG